MNEACDAYEFLRLRNFLVVIILKRIRQLLTFVNIATGSSEGVEAQLLWFLQLLPAFSTCCFFSYVVKGLLDYQLTTTGISSGYTLHYLAMMPAQLYGSFNLCQKNTQTCYAA